MVPMWRMPAQIDWPKKPSNPIQWDQHAEPSADADEWYHRIWHQVESYASALQQANGKPPLLLCLTGGRSKSDACNITPGVLDQPALPQCKSIEASLWRKILHVTGFPDGFLMWWATPHKAFLDSPSLLPTIPPTFDVANAVFLEFSARYKSLEESLVQAKIMHAAQRRINDPLQIYRDLQQERAEPVQTIVVTEQVQVQSIQAATKDHAILATAQPIPQGLDTIAFNDVQTAIEIIDNHHVKIPAAAADSCKDSFTVRKVEADVNVILKTFEMEWSPRWLKDNHEDPAQWEPIVGFRKAAMPAREIQFPLITPAMFRKTVASKRKYAAIGPDGIAKTDMLQMPDAAMTDLIDLLHAVENGMPWPTQAVTGLGCIGQHRPICIYSLFYTPWSSLRARQCLKFLMSLVPSTLMGNIPGKITPEDMVSHPTTH
eukprot:s2528_g3.t1